jgi:hypothetical protein
VSAKPDEFFRHAARLGYFMKMAMQHDMFVEAYGHAPRSVNLLVQELIYTCDNRFLLSD